MDVFFDGRWYLRKTNTILLGIKSLQIQRKFSDNEPVYNKHFLKTKIKSCGEEVRDFYGTNIPKRDSHYTCLAVISLDSAPK